MAKKWREYGKVHKRKLGCVAIKDCCGNASFV